MHAVLRELNLKTFLTLSALTFLPIFLVYLPFVLGLHNVLFVDLKDSGMIQIIRNWDGPHYIVNAIGLYDSTETGKHLFMNLPIEYYAAHFPLFSLAIRFFSPLFGYLYSGLVVNLLFSFASNILFYLIAKRFTKHALALTFVFMFFPPRFFILRTTIAPETMMLFFSLLAFYFWEMKKYFWCGVVAALAVLTKFQIIVLVPGFALASLEEWLTTKKFPGFSRFWLVLPVITFLGLCAFYYTKYGNFFAYFNAQNINKLYASWPFSQFDYTSIWVGSGRLEDIAIYYVGFFTLLFALWKSEYRSAFYFSVLYVVLIATNPQYDITRLSLPLLPFIMLTFEKVWTSKPFQYGLMAALPAIYFYTLNFLMTNQAPIADIGILAK